MGVVVQADVLGRDGPRAHGGEAAGTRLPAAVHTVADTPHQVTPPPTHLKHTSNRDHQHGGRTGRVKA